ncbi:hypothetical protein LT85_2316 [Collimonas arenae]|uniref:Uncharacterized protein n=1 Tax=Collimonas arenae TaxID=279058 RepID=A0A0A1FCR8_9BURK|nr:hypothetical protein LT85_2316 [Collimonas arenae]
MPSSANKMENTGRLAPDKSKLLLDLSAEAEQSRGFFLAIAFSD